MVKKKPRSYKEIRAPDAHARSPSIIAPPSSKTGNKKARTSRAFAVYTKLTLGVLWSLARFTQANFLTLNFARIASNITRFTQIRAQTFVVRHQSASQAVTNRSSLTKATTAFNGNFDIELIDTVGQLERLTHDHTRHFTTKIIFYSAVIDA